MWVLYPDQIGDVGFYGGRKTREPGEKHSEQQQTQPTYGIGLESNTGHIGERQALSPLRQLWSAKIDAGDPCALKSTVQEHFFSSS